MQRGVINLDARTDIRDSHLRNRIHHRLFFDTSASAWNYYYYFIRSPATDLQPRHKSFYLFANELIPWKITLKTFSIIINLHSSWEFKTETQFLSVSDRSSTFNLLFDESKGKKTISWWLQFKEFCCYFFLNDSDACLPFKFGHETVCQKLLFELHVQCRKIKTCETFTTKLAAIK